MSVPTPPTPSMPGESRKYIYGVWGWLSVLVGALIVDDDTELYAITSGGGVIRTAARQVRKAGRQTKGVRLMNLGEGDTLIAVARNAEGAEDPEDDDESTGGPTEESTDA